MRRSILLLLPLLAGCASREVAVLTPPPVVAAVPAPAPAPMLPPGASPGMPVPAMLADGSFPTPNRQLSPAATLWHLRAGLNVAALACPGAQGAAITAGYNAMLGRDKAMLAAAEAAYAAEFKAGGGDWRDRYDDSMTRLYNFWSQTPVRPGLCAAAEQALAAMAVPGGDAPAIKLAALDRPFTDFYRSYDAWRTAQTTPAIGSPVVMAAVTPPRPAAAPAGPVPVARPVVKPVAVRIAPAMATTVFAAATPVPAAPAGIVAPSGPARPRLELDPAIFADAGTAGR